MAVSRADWRKATGYESPATVVRNTVRSPSSARYPAATTAVRTPRAPRVAASHFEAQHRPDRRDHEDKRH